MAATTTDFTIKPEDGWTLIATAPTIFLTVGVSNKSAGVYIAFAGSTPPTSLIGIPVQCWEKPLRHYFSGAIAGNAYLRISGNQSNSNSPTHVSVAFA